jgi:N-acetylmuramoyl-L-alanine amidase
MRRGETNRHANLAHPIRSFRLRVFAAQFAAVAVLLLAAATADGADDAIGRLMQGQDAAKSLPVAPPKPIPQAVAGPTIGTKPQGPLPIVMSARIGEHEDRTRLVIELSDPVNLRAFALANPDRVVIDMPEVSWRLGAPPRPTGFGAVKSYRYGQFRAGNSRMVIDLNQPVTVSDALVIPPSAGFGYRVVIDLFPTTQPKFDSQAGWPADLKKRESDAERLAALIAAQQSPPARGKGKKVIVLDPGHGGLDSGTIGVNGLMEKDLALAEGLKLARELRGRGYSVFMTRDNDTFIPLRQRVAIGRADQADLFIALHADSNPDSSTTGTSIYTLNDGRSDREASALARRENQSDVIAGVDLSGDNNPVAPILINLAQRDTRNKSSEFATNVLKNLGQVTDLLAHSPHRSASLAVLVAPDVPAVLIELGYLSNAADAGQMNTDSWRTKVAGAIADAVDAQFAPVPAAQVAR